jgi:hypothetical protein
VPLTKPGQGFASPGAKSSAASLCELCESLTNLCGYRSSAKKQKTFNRKVRKVVAKVAKKFAVFCYHPILSLLSRSFSMDEVPSITAGSRRNEDIALDLMKFVAMTTGYGRTSSTGAGFQGTGAAAKPEEYAAHLLELYGKCLQAVARK